MTRTARPDKACVAVWATLLGVPLLLALALGLPWWQQVQAQEERLADEREQLRRYQGLVATLPGLRAELAREQANDDFKAFYFDAATSALAGAQLQNEVQEMVRSAGARPISAQVLPEGPDEQPSRVRIRIQMQGTTPQLFDILYRIEEARPFLFIEQLSIRSTTPRVAPMPRRTARSPVLRMPMQSAGELTVRLDIFGYVLGGGP